jgi:hypothetical protein
MNTSPDRAQKVFAMPFASVYSLYVAKAERKGRSKAEVDQAISWLTGLTDDQVAAHVAAGTSFADFFDVATINDRAALITGVICGVRVEEIEDPLMQKIRYLDKLIDEIAKGRTMEKILR